MTSTRMASPPVLIVRRAGSAGGDRQFGDQLLDPAFDLVTDRANRVDALTGGVVEFPVEVALAGEAGADVAAADRDQHVGGFGCLVIEQAWRVRGDVDADFLHGPHRDGVDPVGGFGSGGADLDGVAGEVAPPT